MYLRHVFLNLKSIVYLRPQTIEKFVRRSLTYQIDKHEKSNEKNNEDKEKNDAKLLKETKDFRKAHEKAEWERLSFIEKIVKKYFPSGINSLAIFILAGVSYVIVEQIKNDYEIKQTFRNGSCPNFKFREEQLFERKEILDELSSIIKPVANKLVSSYYIVVGDHGTGKTTLIRQAARQAGRGVIYVDIPYNVERFGSAFARSINFNFKEHILLSAWIESKMFGSPPDDGKQESWERVLATFEKYAIDFKKRYGCVPILIFDNCDSLAKKDKKMLEILQDVAKTAIDDSTWVTIFVGSVGEAPEQMDGRSSITRAASFIEITDLSETEAITYLTEKRNLSKDMAKNIYALFGGRFKRLQNAASKIESGESFSNIRLSTLNSIARRIEKIRCRVSSQEEQFILNILCGLLYRSELTVDDLIEMEKDPNIRQKVLEELRNETILAQHVTTGSYVFHEQATKVCTNEFYKEKKCFSCKWIIDMKF
ncbi:unnamed protein product [Rotaria sp. Silwood2]|nr:unnamed protein product [Rotaria sp. Silwood2]CAF2592134.1 unnamed protein product [Rotaria sp. Silwood2]CAF2976496.1 unnamed protein product [Rotaria sp. Silwood2]